MFYLKKKFEAINETKDFKLPKEAF